MWVQMIFAESVGEEYVADGKGRQIFWQSEAALSGVDLTALGCGWGGSIGVSWAGARMQTVVR